MGTVRYEVLGPLAVRRLDGGRIEVGPEQRKRILAAQEAGDRLRTALSRSRCTLRGRRW